MKTLILIFNFSFLIFNYSPAQQYGWVLIDPDKIPGKPDFSDVFFINDSTGWFTIHTPGLNQIYRTDDGSATFTIQTTSLGNTNAIHMLDINNGYCGGQGGWVYKTNTGGLNWNILNSMGSTLSDISFPPGTDPNNPVGYACGDNGQVWKIDSTLTNLNTGLATTFSGISSPSVNNVWFCGGNRIYYYNGTTFTGQLGPTATFNDIHFINNQEGWVVGNAGIIGRTTNGVTTWVTQTNPDPQSRGLFGVFFLNSNQGWAVGASGAILHTSNGGTTWTVQTATGLSGSAFLTGVQFTSPTNGYIVGNNKTLLKYTLITSASESPETGQVQVYPNPTTGKFKVESLKLKVHRVEVLDLNGKVLEIFSLDTAFSSQEFDIGHLKPGIYLLRLWGNNQSITNKIIKYDK